MSNLFFCGVVIYPGHDINGHHLSYGCLLREDRITHYLYKNARQYEARSMALTIELSQIQVKQVTKALPHGKLV